MQFDLEDSNLIESCQDYSFKIGWLLFTTLPLPCHERGITLTA